MYESEKKIRTLAGLPKAKQHTRFTTTTTTSSRETPH